MRCCVSVCQVSVPTRSLLVTLCVLYNLQCLAVGVYQRAKSEIYSIRLLSENKARKTRCIPNVRHSHNDQLTPSPQTTTFNACQFSYHVIHPSISSRLEYNKRNFYELRSLLPMLITNKLQKFPLSFVSVSQRKSPKFY